MASGPSLTVAIVIPALDEEASVPLVLRDLPREGPGFRVTDVVVVDNGSRDATARVARDAGARVVREDRRGYGAACLRGLEAVRVAGSPDVVGFLDADWSDRSEELPDVLAPIVRGEADLVVGSRLRGGAEAGALLPHARFGNALATLLIRLTTGHRYTDLGPFRAVRWSALERIAMRDRGYGFTVEMQIKAVRRGLRVVEIPVRYRRRVGVSKISGTVVGSIRAGAKILWSVLRYRFLP